MAKPMLSVRRVATEEDRGMALRVLRLTYRREKQWVRDETQVFPETDLQNPSVSWFLASIGRMPAGVIRVLYDPPLEEYREYDLNVVVQRFDIESFLRENLIAEIGRFAVRPRFRRIFSVAPHLMKAATEEAVRRGYSHLITDVFEGEQHSPYYFHKRVIGFETVATHDTGELNCRLRRITMLLNLREAYQRMQLKQSRFFRFLTEGWDDALHRRLSA
ncbi:MAG: GNAT family N-acetyltransferase [Syntrophobacteraceae bacterium]